MISLFRFVFCLPKMVDAFFHIRDPHNYARFLAAFWVGTCPVEVLTEYNNLYCIVNIIIHIFLCFYWKKIMLFTVIHCYSLLHQLSQYKRYIVVCKTSLLIRIITKPSMHIYFYIYRSPCCGDA